MSIKILGAQMLLSEHRYKPIAGTIVTLGRHSVGLTGDQMDKLLCAMKIPKRKGAAYEVDRDTMGGGNGKITQESFFRAFCDANILSIDVNDYEKPEILLDIQERIPWKYKGLADFVYDGGSLDNIFDVASALKNVSKLLKVGGRFFATNNGGSHPTSYLKFSADWFMDFFTINKYQDCKTYICNYPNTVGIRKISSNEPISPYEVIVYAFNPYVTHSTGEGYDCSSIESSNRYQIYCLAEKGYLSTNHKNPIQKHYRVDAVHNKICNASAKSFLMSKRPVFNNFIDFDPNMIPKIDSSDYPEQITPVAVLSREYIKLIRENSTVSI